MIVVHDWLKPIEQLDYVVHRHQESGLWGRFPEAALRFLNQLIGEQPWAPRELIQCLNAISVASPTLLQDYCFKRLSEYAHLQRE